MSAADQHRFVVIARIAAPHGIQGEIRAEILTDFPERFRNLRTVFIGHSPSNCRPIGVEAARIHKKQVLLKLARIDTIEQAEAMRGQLLLVPEVDAVPLADDQYYWHQILGLLVVTIEGQELGPVVDILRTGSNDVYVVRGGSKEILIPAIEDVVKEIDVRGGRMVVELMPGILD